MKTTKLGKCLAIAGIITFGAAGAGAQQGPDFDAVEITSTPIHNGLYMLQGLGGNIGLSVGDDGVFLIDDQYAPLVPKIRAAVAAITDQPITYLFNTHWHGDHSGGNAALNNADTLIIAHDNVRTRMAAEGPRQSPDEALPEITFADNTTLYLNGHKIRMIHIPSAHTDGDAIAYFEGANVIHTGDTLFNGAYPYIDITSGGSSAGYIRALEAIADLANDDTTIIPGHGPIASKADVERTIVMLSDARAKIAALVKRGQSLEETQAADPLAEHNEAYGNGFINGTAMTEILYRDLTANAR